MTLFPNKDEYRIGESVGLNCNEAGLMPQPQSFFKCSNSLTWEPPLPADLRCTNGTVDSCFWAVNKDKVLIMLSTSHTLSHYIWWLHWMCVCIFYCRETFCSGGSVRSRTETSELSVCLYQTGELPVSPLPCLDLIFSLTCVSLMCLFEQLTATEPLYPECRHRGHCDDVPLLLQCRSMPRWPTFLRQRGSLWWFDQTWVGQVQSPDVHQELC